MFARRLAVIGMLAVYLAMVAVSVFGPNPDGLLDEGAEKSRRIEAAARAAADGATTSADLRSAPTRELLPRLNAEEAGNIVMFVPFGLLFPIAWPRLRWLTVPLGVALSGCIELTQGLFLEWRSPRLADIGWNSLGAATGFALWLTCHVVYRATKALARTEGPARSH